MEMLGRDLFLKRTQLGKTTITQHRVWNADLFISAQIKAANEAAAKKPLDIEVIQISSESEYKANRPTRAR